LLLEAEKELWLSLQQIGLQQKTEHSLRLASSAYLFVIYVMTLSSTQTLQHEMTGCQQIEDNVEGRGRALS
jgi:hypothetical protein